MKVLKYFNGKNWVPLYTQVIAKALFAENNLSDVEDRAKSRENLEIIGDNNHTHYHDDRYKPMIQASEDKVMNELEDFKAEVNANFAKGFDVNEYDGELLGLAKQKNGWFEWSGTIESVTGIWIILKLNSLYSATCVDDPRVVLNSNNLTEWYSPYGYWHA